MSNDMLGDRRKAMEEAFFARENEALRKRLMGMDDTRRKKEALSAASGIIHDAVLEKLAALDIHSETLATPSLIPLVAVAWADGTIDDKERGVVFSHAVELGMGEGDVSHELFARWLTERPPQALVDACKDYVQASASTMSDADRRTLKAEELHRAQGVAEAAGGFLGIGKKVSAPEQKVLEELAAVFLD
jgi:hypothetical protein